MAAALSAVAAMTPSTTIAQDARPYEVEDFIRKPKFADIKISPTGEYYAASVHIDQRKTVLVVIRRSDNKRMETMAIPGDRTHVADFEWVNDERIVLAAAEKLGGLERPVSTGELYAVNANGGKGEMLVGARLVGDDAGTTIKRKKAEDVAASLIDELPGNDKEGIISVRPFGYDVFSRAEIMDVYTGKRRPIAKAPIRNADFLTDHAGNVRFAYGIEADRSTRLYYRESNDKEWRLIKETRDGEPAEYPLGFSLDDKIVYLQIEHPQGPDSVVAWDLSADKRTEVMRDDNVDPSGLYFGGELCGMRFLDGLPRTMFFDNQSKCAKIYRKLEKAFVNHYVTVTSFTRDNKTLLVAVSSDQNRGDFYVFDTTTNKADFLLSASDWIDPSKAAKVTPVSIKARDGLDITGYLTMPIGREAKNAPLIVYIHGGPFGIFEAWRFDPDAQMLAAHGYAVLQMNFRGSGNHGYAFRHSGAKQWGGTMQDDITDATKWAIQQGIADAKKICLYGASYGGYASLMGVAKEPGLYACAAGYVGVYDLPSLYNTNQAQQSGGYSKNFLSDWVGPKEDIARTSPNRLASQIKVPVFLAAGGEDETAPIQQTETMEKALRAAGVPVEVLYYPTEGHGFYKIENEREYYGKLLTFFSRHLGGRAPVIVAPAAKK